ncbi:MAG: GNAT family N-acetyltransferase [Bacteroidales bacterium]|jgi:hypothetical protein|nr:GNAT family N-acetyltransferase [Bacteroidales bacterium]
MEFIVKKTTELTEVEQAEILALFNAVFDKTRPLMHFRNQFLNNPLGYSYHSIILETGKIVGCDSYIPSYYLIDGRRLLFSNAVDTMIGKPYRDFVNLYDMVIAVHDYMKKDGVICVYGFPNDNAYPVFHKSKLMKDIGVLATYCLPYRIGGIKPALKAFNCFSQLFAKLYATCNGLFASKKIHRFTIEKEAQTYNATRYKRLDGDYKIIRSGQGGFVYKLMRYEGVRSAFLIDVFDKSAANFNRAVRYILKNHSKEFDILLYAGRLPFKYSGLIKLPQKFSPKKFHFTGEILNKEAIDKNLFFNIDNWDVNLSNYDLL